MLLQTFRVKPSAAKVVVFIGVTKLFPDESSFLNDVCGKIGSAEGWGERKPSCLVDKSLHCCCALLARDSSRAGKCVKRVFQVVISR